MVLLLDLCIGVVSCDFGGEVMTTFVVLFSLAIRILIRLRLQPSGCYSDILITRVTYHLSLPIFATCTFTIYQSHIETPRGNFHFMLTFSIMGTIL